MTTATRTLPHIKTIQPRQRSDVERTRPRPSPNRSRLMLGALLAAMSALGAGLVYSSTGDTITVIGVVDDVPAGRVVRADDLNEIEITSNAGLSAVKIGELDQVIGRVSTTRLFAGSLLTRGQVGDGPPTPAGSSVVGAVLKPGQFPVDLAVGDQVQIIESTPPDASGAGHPVDRGTAVVLDVEHGNSSESPTVVSLIKTADDVRDVSAAGAAGRISLTVEIP